MNPLHYFATLHNLHEPPSGEFQIGAWATIPWNGSSENEETSTAPEPRRNRDDAVDPTCVRFLRHSSGVRWWQNKDPWRLLSQGSDAPSAHRRPGYSLSGCTPAEPDSASPGAVSIAGTTSS